MKRKHAMRFGADYSSGRVRFRLWAPGAERIDLVLDGSRQSMNRYDGGWFELETHDNPGVRYQFAVNGRDLVPDPASRYQPDDVRGPSEVVDPENFEWTDADWKGRPWEEAVIYELHVGSFSHSGSFRAVEEKLDYLVNLGVTAIELMPISDFFGKRSWGYDGVLPFAPDSSYGPP